MVALNSYATIDEFQGIKDIDDIDWADDSVINQMLEDVSQKINDWTGHKFFPRVEIHYFSIPEDDDLSLWLDDDLLEVISVTNGDGVLVAAGDYYLLPRNESPRYAIMLKEMANTYWKCDSSGNSQFVIAVNGIWGFHNQYAQRAWRVATQVNKGGGITAIENPITVDNGLLVKPGQIFKIQNEIMICVSNSETTITALARGDNGSTAATHADDSVVYVWAPVGSIRGATLDIVKSEYHRRFGTGTTGTTTITTAGVVINPEEIPANAWRVIMAYKKDSIP